MVANTLRKSNGATLLGKLKPLLSLWVEGQVLHSNSSCYLISTVPCVGLQYLTPKKASDPEDEDKQSRPPVSRPESNQKHASNHECCAGESNPAVRLLSTGTGQ